MKTAIITGASTGIGRATAIKIAKAGYQVFLIARSKDKLKQTAKLITEAHGQAIVMPTDLSDLKQINNLINKIIKQVKNVDAVINIAGIWHSKDQVYADIDYQDFDQQIILDTYKVGLIAPSLLVHGLLPKMKSGSKVVNLSGTFQTGAKGWLPYFVSKRALEDLTVGLAEELKNKNIQVNCVSPADTATEAYQKYFKKYLAEAVSPDIIAEQIIKLCDLKNKNTGKVIVIKKNKKAFTSFHY